VSRLRFKKSQFLTFLVPHNNCVDCIENIASLSSAIATATRCRYLATMWGRVHTARSGFISLILFQNKESRLKVGSEIPRNSSVWICPPLQPCRYVVRDLRNNEGACWRPRHAGMSASVGRRLAPAWPPPPPPTWFIC
jgi:hypothetical protein